MKLAIFIINLCSILLLGSLIFMDLTSGAESQVWSSHINRHVIDLFLGTTVIVLLIQGGIFVLGYDNNYRPAKKYPETPRQESLIDLEQQLRLALSIEDYEEAAKLHVKIEKLKNAVPKKY